MAMGIAEVIPGISGGTLALILGVYERLIKAIHSFNISLISLLMHRRFKDAWAYVDGNYILVLFIGMLVSIFTLSSLILFFMEVYPTAFKSFLSSVLLFSAFLEPLKPKISKSFFIGIILSLFICSFLYFLPERALTNINPLYLFFSGFIAISALVVPGISGSFILLLMGSYQSILMAVRDLDLLTLFIFLGGALLGLLSIVRLIKLLYDQQKEFLLAVFFGLIIFCIPLLWMNGYSHDADLNLVSLSTGSLIGISLVFIFKKFGKS